jgi:tartrate dehydratase beta subunit/fumarate hydratase class I family protein
MANSFMVKLSIPFTEQKIRALKVGDEVLISGVVFTGRDAAARPSGEKVRQISSNA